MTVIIPMLNLRHSSSSSSAGPDIYDDSEDFEEQSSSSASTKSISQVKITPNITSYLPAQAEEVNKNEYEEESESYPNDDHIDDDTTNSEDSQNFGDKASVNRPDLNSPGMDSNNRKGSDFFSTSRIPFVPSNLWRELFAKPGILVGKCISFFERLEKQTPFIQVLSVE